MLFLLARPWPLVSTGSGYLRPLLEETINGIIIITLPSDIHGNNIQARSVFFPLEKKKDQQADRFHCKSGTQHSNINGNFKKSKSVDRFHTKIDRLTDKQTTDFIFRDTLKYYRIVRARPKKIICTSEKLHLT
jgi:hypothetical protein